MTNPLGAVGDADYVLLTTFRKNGDPVPTPVWAVAEEGKLYVWTVSDSGKSIRLRRNSSVTMQSCNFKGTPHGAVLDGAGRILDADGTEHVRRLLRKKYRWTAPLALLGSNIRRGKSGTVGIEITPTV